MQGTFDYIVVGAGSAGCVIASRLTEDGTKRVLLIEAGDARVNWRVDMPMAVGTLLSDSKRCWDFKSEPEPHLDGRRIDHPRGKMLGGSSSINGMVYTRGHARDYDNWAEQRGCKGWSYAEVLPYFKRSESFEGGEDSYRGGGGQLTVSIPPATDNALNEAFIEAGRQAGYPVTSDQNGMQQEGFGLSATTISRGRRFGTARAFLAPAMARPNLTVITGCLVEKILIEGGRAVGVAFSKRSKSQTAKATSEVILCAGAFGSPQILMLSGVGPAAHLREKGIEVIVDAPDVGRNLQDHPDLILQQWCTQPVSLYSISKGLGMIATGVRWFANRSGPAGSNQFHVAAYIRTRAGIEHPDVKLEMLPIAMGHDMKPLPGHAFQIHMTLMRAESRGHIELASANPADKPLLYFNYLSDPRDMQTFRDALRLTREIVAQPAFVEYAGEEISPGGHVQTEEDIDRWIVESVGTAYHPSCTCRMGGAADTTAVLNPDLSVRGVSGLRVADASIMPMIVSANLNATAIMIADKASDLILGRQALPPSNAPAWVNPDWRTVQR